MKTRHVILGCVGAFALCLVGLLFAGGILVYMFKPDLGSLPKLPAAGILAGEGKLLKSVLTEDSRLSTVTFIGPGTPKGEPSSGLVVVSPAGALNLGADLKERSYVPFANSTTHVDAFDKDGDGSYEFLRRGGWPENAAVIDNKGDIVWTYGSAWGIDDMAAGDLTGDGTMSFAAGFNGAGGIHRVDGTGKKMWSKSGGNVWHVEIFDTDGDGSSEIVHSSASGEITVRSADGSILRTVRVGDYVSNFSLCRWPGAPEKPLIVFSGENEILVGDTYGKIYQRYEAPQCIRLADARSAGVSFSAGQPSFFAVLVSSHYGSVLYVYDASGKLFYEESLDAAGEAIATWKPLSEDGETLLVGGKGRVWQFRLTSPS